ncbi:hypothetical protein VNO77_18922 [Canavalia gladiata]|uniref:Uncharacterized protein n=1 Tax=Canavalia gladiata TaxID=3824 RepID=A0AAN9QKU7_CANGL
MGEFEVLVGQIIDNLSASEPRTRSITPVPIQHSHILELMSLIHRTGVISGFLRDDNYSKKGKEGTENEQLLVLPLELFYVCFLFSKGIAMTGSYDLGSTPMVASLLLLYAAVIHHVKKGIDPSLKERNHVLRTLNLQAIKDVLKDVRRQRS